MRLQYVLACAPRTNANPDRSGPGFARSFASEPSAGEVGLFGGGAIDAKFPYHTLQFDENLVAEQSSAVI